MSPNESAEDAEFAAAVAAAAFAITSLESDEVNQREMERPDRETAMEKPGEASEIYADAETGEITPEKTIHPISSMKKRPSSLKKRLTFADEIPNDPHRPSMERALSMKTEEPFEEDEERIKPPIRTSTGKKTPTFDEGFEYAKKMKPEDIAQPFIPPPAIPPLHIQQPPKGQRPREHETDADVWEREELAKIKERYEKLNKTILEWEEKKKMKAKRKLETTEREVEKRRTKAMQKYQTDMEQIQQISDGAKAQAKEKQKAEELKTKDKANRYEEVNATILEWEEKKKKKASHQLRITEVELENKRAKARQRYQIEMEQIKEIADGARAQAKEKLRNEELKVREKANSYRETGEPPLPPLCQCL